MKHYAGLLIAFILGAMTLWSAQHFHKTIYHSATGKEFREIGKYQFINPLLECDVSDGLIDAKKNNFMNDTINLVQKLISDRNIEISLYYRDLNNGPTFGIRESEEFIPASLLKVPIMMVYYHNAESNPNILESTLLLDKRADLAGVGTQYILPKHTLVFGHYYTIDELINQAIIYSDNDAIALLSQHVSEADLRDLYQLLGVNETPLMFNDGRLTVREYSSFFRVLFNSSYLSREYSEKALALLSQADFREGLVAGVPSNVVVSHKFGESGFEDKRQIHDCGIIYATNRPYLLCIMTQGSDDNTLISTIAEISKFVYGKVSAQK